jgi:hypothetical protein
LIRVPVLSLPSKVLLNFNALDRSLADRPHIFVLDIDGRPTLAFEAASLDQAKAICGDADLRTDLSAMTSAGIPICSATATLMPRLANSAEIASFERAVGLAPASDQATMAFLVSVDGVVIVTTDPS